MPKVSEFQLQRAFCLWLFGDKEKGRSPALRSDAMVWHTANGGYREGREAKHFQEIGVVAGIPDLLFLRLRLLYGMEFKAPDQPAKPSKAQEQTARGLLTAGMAAYVVVNNLQAAKNQAWTWGLVDSPF